MVRAHKELASIFGISITHISEQSCHNKVKECLFKYMYRYYLFQDTADGEFAVVKTALYRYMLRSDVNSPDYLEVKDSASLQQFGQRFLQTPGSRSQLKIREFIDLKPEEVLSRKAKVEDEDSRTLAGISSKFQYICKVWIIICLFW
jgi:hypothetical protein